MSRPMLRSTALLFLCSLGLTLMPAAALAQTNAAVGGVGLNNIIQDPFTFYYAYYLPNQQLQSMRPSPSDTINQQVINRQYYAQTGRESLYNPISPYAEEYDPLRPYSRQQGAERLPGRTGSHRVPRTATVPAPTFTTIVPHNTSPASDAVVAPMRTSRSLAVEVVATAAWVAAARVEWVVVVAWVAWVEWVDR